MADNPARSSRSLSLSKREATTGEGYLLHNLVLFGQILHRLGFDMNPRRTVTLHKAISLIDIGSKEDFYYTLRGLLVHRRQQLPLFDEAFTLFWKAPDRSVGLDLSTLFNRQPPTEDIVVVPPMAEGADNANNNQDDATEEQTVIELTRTFSAREALRQKDFSQMTVDELTAVKKLLASFIWSLGEKKTRRLEKGLGRAIDFRRTLRYNLKHGGEFLHWATRQRKIKPRPLIILADISGSMEQYSRLLLHFIYSLAGGLDQHVEAFVFSTRLTRITRQLRRRNIDQALADIAHAVPDWSGGTRIGEAIKQFNFKWGRRVLRGGAVVLLISDGWDRGDPDVLGREMARLNRTTHRVVWLNPLLGSSRYQPLTRGMVAALPHINDFLPVHNLASLEQLADHLDRLDRPRRSQALSGAAFVNKKQKTKL